AVPGFGDLEKRQGDFQETIRAIGLKGETRAEVRQAKLAKGMFLVGTDLDAMLRKARLQGEPIVDAGVRFVHRSYTQGHPYFLVNRGDRPLDGWVTLGTSARSAVILDPRFEDRTGVAKLRRGSDDLSQVYLQLQPGESCVLRTFADKETEGRPWRYTQTAG